MSNHEGYLTSLRDQGKKRVRLTRQLQEIVGAALAVIAKECEPGTTYTVPKSKLALTVVELETSLGIHRVVSAPVSSWDRVQHRVFAADREPYSKWFLDGDFDFEVRNVSREEWLTVANALPAVAAGFLNEDTRIRLAIREAIRQLRVWSDER